MKKRRQRRISVLLIPDDNAEPISFRLSWVWAKVLAVVVVVMVLHIIGGIIGYVQYAKARRDRSELERSNTRLLEDNKRVYRLAALLEEMDKDQGKIMSLLGVESRNGQRSAVELSLAPEAAKVVEAPNAIQKEEYVPPAREYVPELKGSFLKAKKQGDEKSPPYLPALLPAEGYVTDEFMRSPWFPFNAHTGIDIAGKQGSQILAAGSGHVIYAGWHVDLGNLIIIHHGNNLFSWYGHNERLLVREKEYVKRAEPIALLGSSGRSSGPHLHFEIWQDGKPVDPRQFILAFRAAAP